MRVAKSAADLPKIMKPKTVHLGFEIPSGEPVEIPLAHLCVTGQTQLSGKTTTLEALVSRSGLKAIAFITKRGESAFATGSHKVGSEWQTHGALRPFFRHRADWQFVSDILGAILSEKLKFQRPWIMKVCRGAKNLADVQARVKKALDTAKGLSESVYTELDEYFDLLIPEIERLPYTDKLELSAGLNVMDLSEYSTALQMLVISSVLDEVYQHHKGVITVIPEAWEFVPNNKNSPAKSAAITLARKGAALKNFNWYDSQDLASIDTEIRRSVSIWILGVQREQNEVKRMLSHIPNAPKPKVDDVMQLEKGQFFVCHGRDVRKVYVQPVWMTGDVAQSVARGVFDLDDVIQTHENEQKAKELRDTRITVSRVNTKTGAHTPEPPKPTTIKITDDVDHPRDSVTLMDPSRLPAKPDNMALTDWFTSKDFNDQLKRASIIQTRIHEGDLESHLNASREKVQKWAEGADYAQAPNVGPIVIDDGGKTVDQQEREHFAGVINNLRLEIAKLKRRHGEPLDPDEVILIAEAEKSSRAGTATGISAIPTVEYARTPTTELPEFIAKMLLDDEKFISRLAARMPSNGAVKVEPREVVLKDFASIEVERILEATKGFTPWQKQVIRLLEAKGQPMQKAAIVTAITGRKTVNMPRDFKDEYTEIDELALIGFVRKDPKNGIYPSLGVGIKKRLEQFEPTNEEIDAVIGQIMLRLKE